MQPGVALASNRKREAGPATPSCRIHMINQICFMLTPHRRRPLLHMSITMPFHQKIHPLLRVCDEEFGQTLTMDRVGLPLRQASSIQTWRFRTPGGPRPSFMSNPRYSGRVFCAANALHAIRKLRYPQPLFKIKHWVSRVKT